MITLIERVNAVNVVKDAHAGIPFAYGKNDCVTMARAHLERIGHLVPALPRYTTARGGLVALKRIGFADLPALLDSMLERISPAEMLPGDVAAVAGGDGFHALGICAGKKIIGFHEEALAGGIVPIVIDEFAGAWRVGRS